VIRDALRDITVNADPPKIPWGMIGAAFLLAIFGVGLWRSTAGKVMIIVAVVLVVLSMMGMLQSPGG